MTQRVAQGAVVTLTVVWTADAADTSLTMLTPAGLVLAGFPVVLPAVIHDATGVYHYAWLCPAPTPVGDYTALWEGTPGAVPTTKWEVVTVHAVETPSATIIPLVEALGLLGVTSGTDEATSVSTLLGAVSAEIRRLANREFTGSVTTHDEILIPGWANPFRLSWVPVHSITSLARVYFDGTEDTAYAADEYRLEDAARGIVRLRRGVEYVRAVYTSTGEIPAAISEACREWLRDRWTTRDQNAALAGYHTGEDVESYFPAVAGKPPRAATLAIYGARHERGGGVV